MVSLLYICGISWRFGSIDLMVILEVPSRDRLYRGCPWGLPFPEKKKAVNERNYYNYVY